ncbi:putative metabolite transport protein, partial [Termitomyces sp. J132]
GYSNGVIGSAELRNGASTVLIRVYGQDTLANHNYSTVVSSMGFAGFVVGMLLFGFLSDKVGRKFGMMTSSGIILVFSGLSAASSGANGSVSGLLSMLSAMRFFLGIGLGAEYPSGSVSASEQSEEDFIPKNARHRWLALATDPMIDFGFVIAAFVPLVLFWIFGNDHLRAVWRISLGLGMVPALGVFLWRLNMDEPLRFKKDSMKYTKIPYLLVLKRYWRSLAAISFVWFLYDMVVYPFGIYSSIIVNNITGGSEDLTVVFGWNVVINLFDMPGSILGAFVLDNIGPKNTLIIGLVLQAIVGFLMSGLYVKLTEHIAAFAVVYGIFLSLGEFGPGICTFVLASKSCPTAVRGHYFGIAAATGKVGAFVGTWSMFFVALRTQETEVLIVFPPIIKAFGGPNTVRGNTGPFWIGSGLALLSALVTMIFVKPLSPEGIEKEDHDFRKYLEAHGYDTSRMGLNNDANSVDVEDIDVEVTGRTSTEKA